MLLALSERRDPAVVRQALGGRRARAVRRSAPSPRSIRSTLPSSASTAARRWCGAKKACRPPWPCTIGRGSPPMRIMYLDGNHQANDSAGDGVRPPPHRRAAGDAASRRRRRRWWSASAAAPRPARSPVTASMSTSSSCRRRWSPAPITSSTSTSTCSTRPNVHLRVDDGRNFLLMTRKKYDVITADIILPRHAGAGALYSQRVLRAGPRRAGRGRPRHAMERRRGGRPSTSC